MITKSFEEISVGRHCGDGPAGRHRRLCAKFRRPHLGTAILFTSTPTTRSRRASVARSPTVLSCCPPCSVWWRLDPRYLQCFYGARSGQIPPARLTSATRCMRCRKCCRCALARDGETAIVTSKGSLVNQDGDLVFSGEFLIPGRRDPFPRPRSGCSVSFRRHMSWWQDLEARNTSNGLCQSTSTLRTHVSMYRIPMIWPSS